MDWGTGQQEGLSTGAGWSALKYEYTRIYSLLLFKITKIIILYWFKMYVQISPYYNDSSV